MGGTAPGSGTAEQLLARFAERARREPAERWTPDLTGAAEQAGLTVPALRSVATDLTWIGRSAGLPTPSCDGVTGPRTTDLVATWVRGQRLRFDFRFRYLADFASERLAQLPDDGLVLALAACGALGDRRSGALELVDRAVAVPDADARSRHVCLHGLWAAHHSTDAARRTIDLGQRMIDLGEDDANVWFRLSSAYRCLHRWDDALASVDEALLRLADGSIEVGQDYVRERELVVLAMQTARAS